MDFKQLLQIVRRRWRTILSVLVLALGLSAVLSTVVIEPRYESKSRIFLSVDVRNTTDAYAALFFVNTRATSYADLAKSSELAQRTIETLDLDLSPEELSDLITAQVIDSTSLIELRVVADDPRDAQVIADVATHELTAYIAELESPGGGTAEDAQIQARVTDEATYEPDPVSPRLALNLAAAGLIGLMLGFALAIARNVLDRTISSADDVAAITDAPVLASIGYDSSIRATPLLTDLGAFAARTEAFRLLRTNMQFVNLDARARCLVVTSAIPSEGKTMTAVNLAIAVAQTGRSTIIVDADLRRPRVASSLGVDPAIGLTTTLIGRAEIEDAIQVHEPSGVHVLASGAKPPNPTEILQSKVTHDLIKRLRSSYDTVIIDAPPLLPVADASVLSALADGTVLVVRHGRTTKDQVADAITRIQRVEGRLYGVVVNMVAKRAAGSYYYYYYEETSPVRTKTQPGQRAAPRTTKQPKPRRRRDDAPPPSAPTPDPSPSPTASLGAGGQAGHDLEGSDPGSGSGTASGPVS